MSKKLLATLSAVAAIALGVAAYLWNPTGTEDPSSRVEGSGQVGKILVGYPVLRIALPVFVAQERGLFKKHGVEVQLVRFETAQPMMDALVGGSISVGGYCALPITFAAIARSKRPLVFISGMMEDDQHPISLMLVKKGAAFDSLKDLAGKRIGILPTRAYEMWLRALLSANDVDPNDVVIQQIAPPQQAAALRSGSIDALFTNDPAATAAQTVGTGVVLLPGTALVPRMTGLSPFYFGSFNVDAQFAAQNPDIVRRLAGVLDEAIEFIAQHQNEARAAMARFLPEEQRDLVVRFPPSLFKKTNAVTQADLEAVRDYYLDAGILTVPIDLSGSQYRLADE